MLQLQKDLDTISLTCPDFINRDFLSLKILNESLVFFLELSVNIFNIPVFINEFIGVFGGNRPPLFNNVSYKVQFRNRKYSKEENSSVYSQIFNCYSHAEVNS